MNRKWIPVGLAVGLLAAAITGGAVWSSGGDETGNGGAEVEEVVVEDVDTTVQSIENTEVETGAPDELAVKVAEILGTDPQATHDAMVQADQVDLSGSPDDSPAEVGDEDSMSVEAEGLSYLEYGNRIGAILGVDGLQVANALAQAYEELYGVERDIRDSGSGRDADGKYEADKHPAEPAG